MIHTVHLFPVLDAHLISLLRSLKPEDWNRPTVARLWTVKDVATHLLDGNCRTISMMRDGHMVPPDREINSYESLVGFLNQLNADWVAATRRISPALLTDLLEITGREYSRIMSIQDLQAPAPFAVSWAGETTSPNWFHIAREYTEKFHHQQQIREAMGDNSLFTRELFFPFIDTLMRGLPHAYRNLHPESPKTIQVQVESEIGGNWFLSYEEKSWRLTETAVAAPEATLLLPPSIAWKLFTKGLSPQNAEKNCTLSGEKELLYPALNMIAVMA